MNKKLEKTFDLPSMEEALEDQQQEESNLENSESEDLDRSSAAAHAELEESEVADEEQIIKRALTTAEKIDKALPQVKDLQTHDTDMDSYSGEAMKSYRELMDLGMNSEARHAGKFFEVAQTMMKNAIEAKNAKADKKLRMIELQLKKQRVDQWDKRDGNDQDVIEGEGFVVGDRNKLLDQLIEKVNQNDDKTEDKDK
mgnify:CR=1 FL=1|jgi:hypothetical protein|tara:strand:+ start:185 stop:778 length:594 start_codon:yes stop_codon:yes gene_type:complete